MILNYSHGLIIIELESEPDNAWNSFKSLPWITPTIKDLMKKRYYHHKKAVKTNKSFTGAATKNCVTLCRWNFVRKKPGYYSNQLYEKQDSRKSWKTLNELIPKKKQHKTANAPASENLTATSFNEFFTSVAEKLCGRYKSKTTRAARYFNS